MLDLEPLSLIATLDEKTLFYDCEIKNLIEPWEGYKSCKGWQDFKGMGIAVIGTFSLEKGYYCFFDSELKDFENFAQSFEQVVGFNSINFDDRLLLANGVRIQTNYDLLEKVRYASGQPRKYVRGLTRAGYSLEALAKANLRFAKTGSGALAPKLWQEGRIGQVIDYCLNDVKILVHLFKKRNFLIDPTNGSHLNLLLNPKSTLSSCSKHT